MAHLLGFAVVGADGTQLHADGVSNIEHAGVGLYRITFTNSVYNACEIASLGHWETAGYVTAYGVPPFGPSVVEVMTFGPNGAARDLTFQLLVIAPDITTGTVPDVTGENKPFTVAQAENMVRQAGFLWVVDSYDPIGAKREYVEDQNPLGGTVAPLGTTVHVTIATTQKE